MPDARTQRAIAAVEAAWPHLATDAFVEQVVITVLDAAAAETSAEPVDLGDGYHELELAQGRWYWLDELGIRVMVDRRPPLTVLRWKALGEPAEQPEPAREGEALGVTDEQRQDLDKVAGDLRDVLTHGFRTGYQCAIGGDTCPGHSSKWLMCDPGTRAVGDVTIRTEAETLEGSA